MQPSNRRALWECKSWYIFLPLRIHFNNNLWFKVQEKLFHLITSLYLLGPVLLLDARILSLLQVLIRCLTKYRKFYPRVMEKNGKYLRSCFKLRKWTRPYVNTNINCIKTFGPSRDFTGSIAWSLGSSEIKTKIRAKLSNLRSSQIKQ
jgi:hypothetical protein